MPPSERLSSSRLTRRPDPRNSRASPATRRTGRGHRQASIGPAAGRVGSSLQSGLRVQQFDPRALHRLSAPMSLMAMWMKSRTALRPRRHSGRWQAGELTRKHPRACAVRRSPIATATHGPWCGYIRLSTCSRQTQIEQPGGRYLSPIQIALLMSRSPEMPARRRAVAEGARKGDRSPNRMRCRFAKPTIGSLSWATFFPPVAAVVFGTPWAHQHPRGCPCAHAGNVRFKSEV
jgi:hypothetical protein